MKGDQWRIMELLELLEFTDDDDEQYRLPRKYLADVQNPFERYSNNEFRLRFRFSKDATHYLFGLLKDDEELTCRDHALPPILQLTCALRFFADGHFQQTDGDLAGISKVTAHRSIHKITRAICRKKLLFLNFPTDLAKVKQEFYDIAGFPNVVGAIDCTHLPIISPGGDNAEVFRNRKGYFSLNVQMICDAQRVVTNIVTRWYGSCHDSRIFDNSVIRDRFEDNQIDGYLLGDNGYPLRSYLLTPLLSPRTSAEKKYNHAHIVTRSRIEQCFGMLKKRFFALAIPMRTKLSNSTNIVVAITCLHNLAIRTRQMTDETEVDDVFEPDASDHPHVASTPSGQSERQSIILRYFSN